MKSRIAQLISRIREATLDIGYIYRLVVDQSYVMREASGNFVRFRNNIVPGLGTAPESFTTRSVRQSNLRRVVECIESAGIDYFIIPDSGSSLYKVGVLAANRKKLLDEMNKQYRNTGVYIAKPSRPRVRQIISNKRSLSKFYNEDVIRIYSNILSPKHDVLAAELDGCDVEFWERSDRKDQQGYLKEKLVELRVNTELKLLKNTLIAPRGNLYTGILPLDEVKIDRIILGGKEYKTYDVFNRKTIYDIDFPIDVVYSWVDGNDPKWKVKFNKYKGIKGALGRNNTESRYKDRQELKYSLRSLHMYAPFVRNIYIVTDEQVPEWLDKSVPGVKIVDHKEIFSDPSALPVFNSHAIGAQIHHIKGLSDRYLYLNDDMMFARSISSQKFFHSSGIAKLAASPALIHAGGPKDYEPSPSSAGKNVRKLLGQTFDRQITHKFKHSPNPQIKEVAYELEKKYPDAVKRTASSRFRSKSDVQFASLFHHSYSLITGRAVVAGMRSAVVNISDQNAQGVLDTLLEKRNADTICLNESETPADRQDQVEEMVHTFLERYYPYPSPWEKK